jgi:hypothetical protein
VSTSESREIAPPAKERKRCHDKRCKGFQLHTWWLTDEAGCQISPTYICRGDMT